MDGNKDEAARCIGIAEAAIASGDKQCALKFMRIAQRLNNDYVQVDDDLLAACENLEECMASTTTTTTTSFAQNQKEPTTPSNKSPPELSNGNGGGGNPNYIEEEHVKLIREVNKKKDYYAILGLERNCSVDEIRKSYRKLSLKVHPDKNKAPGSEEAFKKVCKAFKCLSDEDSRRQYDQTGIIVEEFFEYNQQHNDVRRRRRTAHDDYFDDDDDEIFRSFFGQADMFRTAHVYRTRGMAASQQRENNNNNHGGGGVLNLMVLVQILPFLVIFLLAYLLPFSQPNYSLRKTYSYYLPKVTEKHGVEFYVKSPDFDQQFPIGSSSRANLENHVVRDYKHTMARYCRVELQRRRNWDMNYPTPNCDRLRNLGMVA